MSNGILVFTDISGGALKESALEATSAAAKLAGDVGGGVATLTVGKGAGDAAGALGEYGATRMLVVDDEGYENHPEGLAAAVEAAMAAFDPRIVLFSENLVTRDLAPRVAAGKETSVLSDLVALTIEDGKPVGTRPIFAGKVNQRVTTDSDPAFVTIRPRMFGVEKSGDAGSTEALSVEAPAARVELAEFEKADAEKVSLVEADRIVSGGRGLKGPEHFHLIEELAAALGAAVGASRAVVDAGWRPHEEQVGQTGKTVTPTLYVACGISGAIQHLAGMSRAKVIVAINKDAEAPIFNVADYGIVGDVFEVLPVLTEEAKKISS